MNLIKHIAKPGVYVFYSISSIGKPKAVSDCNANKLLDEIVRFCGK